MRGDSSPCSIEVYDLMALTAEVSCGARGSSSHSGGDTLSDIDWYQKWPGLCSSHLLNPARDRNMQIRRDPYSLESTRLDPRNRGFTRVARGEQPISERLGINK